MVRGSKKDSKWTLHIKNTKSCPWSKGFYKFADFDTYEEVQKSGEPFRKCKRCFEKNNHNTAKLI